MRVRDLLEKLDMESVDPDAHVLVRNYDRPEQFTEAGAEAVDVEYHEGVEVWIEHDERDEPNRGFVVVPALVIG